ncbi:MAG: recombinase family protein [Candidatus Berkelbacteria bacterium]|nr:recombinase family protein [Candidatus Berkelbacteria bacterium]
MKYFLYARKSTEDEERQVMSIEAQIFELEQYAQRENISISERFIESKSAKKPGREIFNQMMAKVYESTEPVGLISWHPDRLARNSVDGGQIIYCIDTKKIISLRFPCFWFEPTPQGLFMLQVAFGQSKYYSDNLSENVKRGIRQKLRRGEWLSKAPLGYNNNLKTRNIELDPIKHKIIKKIFTEFAEGKYTLQGISERLSFLGETAKGGKLHCKSMIQKLLINKVYIGLINYNGEIFPGSFPPIIDKKTFDKVQEVLKLRARPRKSKVTHNFPFTGLFHCAECKAMITAQFGHGNGGEYRYYRCTKRLGPCSQKYIQEKELVEHLKEKIMKVSISDGWINKMLDKTKEWEKSAKGSQKDFAQNLNEKIKAVDNKLDKLVNEFLDGNIEKEIYLKLKNELVQKKKSFEQQKTDFGRNKKASFGWIEPLKDWVNSLAEPATLQNATDFLQIKSFVQKIGTNHQLQNKKALFFSI